MSTLIFPFSFFIGLCIFSHTLTNQNVLIDDAWIWIWVQILLKLDMVWHDTSYTFLIHDFLLYCWHSIGVTFKDLIMQASLLFKVCTLCIWKVLKNLSFKFGWLLWRLDMYLRLLEGYWHLCGCNKDVALLIGTY